MVAQIATTQHLCEVWRLKTRLDSGGGGVLSQVKVQGMMEAFKDTLYSHAKMNS